MPHTISRRHFLAGSAALVGMGASRRGAFAATGPSAPVAVARCETYGAELLPTLERMFDQLGGLGRLVEGRTVGVKLNMTGRATERLQGIHRIGSSHWVHPRVIGSLVHLMDRAGAHRIRLLESAISTATPLDEFMYQAGWDVEALRGAGRRVEFENTNWLGRGRSYHRIDVPGSPLLFPAYLVNHSFVECDLFVSLGKLKEHITTGVTLSMKNCFGTLPATIYGDGAPEDEPSEEPRGGRNQVFHRGERQPAKIAPPELDPGSPRREGYRLPRVVVDLCAARPIDLALIDGIESMSGSEGPWAGGGACRPGVLVAGTNCVNTDAVATAVMGYDPLAPTGTAPFATCDNFLELAEKAGLGTRDPGQIEVVGTPIQEARFDFAPLERARPPWPPGGRAPTSRGPGGS